MADDEIYYSHFAPGLPSLVQLVSLGKKVQLNVSWLEVIVHEVHFAVIRYYRPFCTEGGPEGPPWVPMGGILVKNMSLKGGSIELGMF